MERLIEFEKILIAYLEEFARENNRTSDLKYEVLVDKEKKHYQLVRLGWAGAHNLYSILLHFEIRNNKIWILQNLTENSVAQELTEKGISPSSIVLGFQPEHRRPYTGYAVA